ncbi:MAG: response regulator transcription factor [Verrucomicrobiales bacterium]|jgi:DNA-binding response OmpR family regulator|nr:response regulator transcription factor [Verrucomicrobiales bacterium]
MKKHILVVEDDSHIRMGIVETLLSENFAVSEVGDGRQVAALVRERKPDLILLDIMLPGKSGYDVCRELRQNKVLTPVIMLTAKGQEIDKVVGLELGADDYVTKPFGVRELVARIQAVLRRTQGANDETGLAIPKSIEFGKVRIDTASLRGCRGKEAMELSPRELKVLALLFQERGKVVSRDALLNKVWGMEYYGTTRTLDQVIVKLRQKIEDRPEEPKHLQTVYGMGYRLDV